MVYSDFFLELKDRDCFGDLEIVFPSKRVQTAKAVTDTYLIKFSKALYNVFLKPLGFN